MRRLSESVITLYAELLDQCITADVEVGAGRGSFVSKTIKNATYWYQQRTFGPERTQVYLGRETPALLEWINKAKDARAETRADDARRRDLVRMLTAGGAVHETGATAQTLRVLADSGMFRLGGVLVGTQAFGCYANMLGVRFEEQSLRTADIDIAHDSSVALGMSRDSGVAELKSSEPRFFSVPGLDPREPSTSVKVRGRDMRIDFLTTATRRTSGPVTLPHFGIAAQPLPAMDYLIEASVPAVVVGGSGILVNVPDPARFALHKLWVAQQRPVSEQAKVRKDIRQAEQVLMVLSADRPGDITAAWRAAEPRRTFARSIKAAIRRLPAASEIEALL